MPSIVYFMAGAKMFEIELRIPLLETQHSIYLVWPPPNRLQQLAHVLASQFHYQPTNFGVINK